MMREASKKCGRTFFLLRGLSRESRHWFNFPQLLKEMIPGCEVHLIDYPGAGKRYRETFPLDTYELVEDLKKQFDQFEISKEQTRHIITISLGGMVVLNFLKYFPEYFQSATIINSSVRDLSPFYKRFRPQIWKSAIQAVFSKNATLKERQILSFTSRLLTPAQLDNLAITYGEYANEYKMNFSNIIRQLLWAMASKSPDRLETKTLFLSSKADQLCDVSCGEKISSKYKMHFEAHEEAGHDLPLDDGEWIISRIEKYL